MQENSQIMLQSEKSPIYDIAKALGIIAIVLGHCCPIKEVVLFVYGYHLTLFFFVSGATYNEEKYALKPFVFLQARVKILSPGYFVYMSLFTLINNFAVWAQMLPYKNIYSIKDICERIWENFIFSGSEMFGGAFWFVPALLIALMAFSAITFFATRYGGKFKIALIIIFCGLIGCAGIIFNLNKISLLWHSHTSMLVLPIICAGFLFGHYNLQKKHIFRWYIAVICLVFFSYFVVVKSYQIELSAEMIASKYLFYPLSFAGIYFIFYICTLIEKSSILKNALSFVGKYSFDIMAMHFLIIKVIDAVYGRITNQPLDTMPAFPRAYGYLWPIYLAASVTIPPLLRMLANTIWKALNRKIAGVK